ncbi:hypothetical protein ACWERI_04530 [Streptomyces collinus]
MKVRLPSLCAGVLVLTVFALLIPGVPWTGVWVAAGLMAAAIWILDGLLMQSAKMPDRVSSILVQIQQIPALTALLLLGGAVIIFIAGRYFEPAATDLPAPQAPSFAIRPAPDEFGERYLEKPISVNIKVSQGPYVGGKTGTCIDFFASGPGLKRAGRWTLEIDADSRSDLNSVMTTESERPAARGHTRYTLSSSRISYPDAKATLCWDNISDMVVARRASNIAISMPNFWVDQTLGPLSGRPNVPVHVQAELDDVGSDWAVDAGNAPEAQVSTFGKWVWKNDIGEIDTQPQGSTALVQAHSINGAAKEHQNEFLSGILFGVAAAAAVTGFQELVNWYRDLDLTGTPQTRTQRRQYR